MPDASQFDKAKRSYLVLSPHLDDGVLSCGQLISMWRRQRHRVVQATVFTGRPEVETAVVREDAARYDGDVLQTRLAEEATAARLLDYEPLTFGLPELIFRSKIDGSPRCEDLSQIFGALTPSDVPIIHNVADRLRKVVAKIRPDFVCAPLGVGGHIDHVIIREAARTAVNPLQLRWYRDLPYALDEPFDELPGSNPEVANVDDGDVERWLAAIDCYASQVRNMFGDTEWKSRFREFVGSGAMGLFLGR